MRSKISAMLAISLTLGAVMLGGEVKPDNRARGHIEATLPVDFGEIVCTRVRPAPLAPSGAKEDPWGPRRFAVVESVNDVALLPSPKLIVGGFDKQTEDAIRRWFSEAPHESRTVYGYETVQMEGIPNGTTRYPALRSVPLPAGPSFSVQHLFIIVAIGQEER